MKILSIIMILLFISNILLIFYLCVKFSISYKDDLTEEEKVFIRDCLLHDMKRKMLCGQDIKQNEYILAKWEVVSGMEDKYLR